MYLFFSDSLAALIASGSVNVIFFVAFVIIGIRYISYRRRVTAEAAEAQDLAFQEATSTAWSSADDLLPSAPPSERQANQATAEGPAILPVEDSVEVQCV